MSGNTWQHVELPGDRVDFLVDHSPGLVMVGGGQHRPFLVLVDHEEPTRELEIPSALADQGPPRIARWGHGGLMGVCGATGLWRQDQSWETSIPELPVDESGQRPEWLWLTSGDDELRVIAVYPTSAGREMRIWDDELNLLSRESPLLLHEDHRLVQVAAFAGRVSVCGHVGGVLPGEVTLWWSRTYQLPEYHGEPEVPRWEPVTMEAVPDLVSHGHDWDAGAFFTGLKGERALAWDQDGYPRDLPDVLANRATSVVILAEVPPDEEEGASVAVQTTDGGILVHAGSVYPMPPGELTSAVLNRGFDRPRGFAVVDGELFVIELEY